MENQISALDSKPSLLLHCCCAPCSSACLERLKEFFDITVFFYNPNIVDGEYLKRKAELLRLINETGWAKIADCGHDPAEAAEKLGCDYFGTTLTISPLKNAALINRIGEQLSVGKSVHWLYSDFKKRGGYLRSLRLSEQYGLYRQSYCGCEFSKRGN